MSGGEMKYVNEAFSQNWIAPLGPNVVDLEAEIARYCGVKDAAVLNSGTAAIHLALIMLGVGKGDEVIAYQILSRVALRGQSGLSGRTLPVKGKI